MKTPPLKRNLPVGEDAGLWFRAYQTERLSLILGTAVSMGKEKFDCPWVREFCQAKKRRGEEGKTWYDSQFTECPEGLDPAGRENRRGNERVQEWEVW